MGGEVVLVAVDASKEITKYALEWAVGNLVDPTDSLVFLALLPSDHSLSSGSAVPNKNSSGIQHFLACIRKKFQSHQVATVDGVSQGGASHRITEDCGQMMRQLCVGNNLRQVQTTVNVVADAALGTVAAKAENLGATWVVLDRRLKKEADYCVKQLSCNVVLVDHTITEVLKSVTTDTDVRQNGPTLADMLGIFASSGLDSASSITSSSLGFSSHSTRTDGTRSLSSPKHRRAQTANLVTSVLSSNTYVHQVTQIVHQVGTEGTTTTYPTRDYSKSQPLRKASISAMEGSLRKPSVSPRKERPRSYSGLLTTDTNTEFTANLPPTALIPARRSTGTPPRFQRSSLSTLQSKKLTSGDWGRRAATMSLSTPMERLSSIRKSMSISIKQPPTPPPLCSICKHSAPIFGKSPRKFTYKEIENATGGFSGANFLDEGGYGPGYRGITPDGQVVAVKRPKGVSAQGASQFCSEVELLSCAQHRNLVMLVGYCTEPEWLLVYEFACNGSLDKHLYGNENREVMAWKNRMKVATGAARGLRYLHDDCRVGCIVHRDLRPKNILLTHDFEPMVSDFGLARLQVDRQSPEETRVIGAFGYLAPEYTQTGLITEKADVYAFGVVLLELVSGLKATNLSRNEKQRYLPEWFHVLLKNKRHGEMIDPRLEGNYDNKEVESMLHTAELCIQPDPKRRPEMSKVLRMLEGDIPKDIAHRNEEPASHDAEHRRRNSHNARVPITRNGKNHMRASSVIPRAYKVERPTTNVVPAASGADYGKERARTRSGRNQNQECVTQGDRPYVKGSLVEFIENIN